MSEAYSLKQIEIMDTAMRLFAKKGFDSTSVRDIAKEAGVNLAMISYYFGSKDKLLESIFLKQIKTMGEVIEAIVKAEGKDPFEKMNLIVDAYIDAIMKHRHFHLIMIREQVMTKNELIYKSVRELKQRNLTLIQNALNAGVKAGFFRKSIDAYLLSITLVGTTNQLFSSKKYLCERYKIDENDDVAFEKIVIKKLRNHIKSLFKSFLRNE